MIYMKMDLKTPNQKLEERLKEIEDKLNRVLELLEAKELKKKTNKVDE